MPAAAIELAYRLGPSYALLADAVRRDEEWLLRVLSSTAAADPFTGRLLEIARLVRHLDGDERQPAVLGLLRSDYMIDDAVARGSAPGSADRLLQVELNTVAAGFAAISTRVSEVHATVSAPAMARSGVVSRPLTSPAAPQAGWTTAAAGASLAVVAGPTCPAVAKDGATADQAGLPPAAPAGAGGLPTARATTAAAVASYDLPPNSALAGMAASLAAAAREYSARMGPAGTTPKAGSAAEPVVLCVVQPRERNFSDQRLLETALLRDHGVRTVRRTLEELAGCAVLTPRPDADALVTSDAPDAASGSPLSSRRLFLRPGPSSGASATDGAPPRDADAGAPPGPLRPSASSPPCEVAVIYLRSGYGPGDYGDGDATLADSPQWRARLLLERSAAVRSPDVWVQLVGAKKVQQVLARPGALERFLGDSPEAAELRSSFAGLWSLDFAEMEDDEAATADARAAVADATERPERYVLKPQREGGGHNFFGRQMVSALRSWPASRLAGFILMQRIDPAMQMAAVVRGGKVDVVPTLCEFGIYTGVLGTGARRSFEGATIADAIEGVAVNATFGHLVRTKTVGTDEGGVAAGFAVLDSPWLTRDE